ncbi:IucA/IucC family siderophore biosynthesis protein [Nocardiopsis sp. JB363]|uniref:IucA/IucC family protein n=1 Tax=Nocardiopsis sp. JB363 TaxID=1434837 RepID=UPI00097A57B6|nr:IucA/IucC family siderophore biosynthesis protein [Nocardiopsis sp. JB363]SIO88003.1 Desferrioxamine E biosynthesis protein DesD @ Siderophore synthetase superfamily, group C @ Siderophore synthetase component, ligase [Nocardiopsis sp. JB363]
MTIDHDPRAIVDHLAPEPWAHANRLLVRKALAEFTHERLLFPEPEGENAYKVLADNGAEYRFTAHVMALDHWRIDADSIVRRSPAGEATELDALDLVLDLRETLGLSEEVLPVYLEEISSTLASSAFRITKGQPTAAELARSGFQDIEVGMTEGHPCFVANNGRLGFDAAEYRAYAPEAGEPVRLVWVAARRSRTTFSHSADTDPDTFLRSELGSELFEAFEEQLVDLGLDPADYHLVPVHPWQWWNRLAVTFAADVARRDLVCLGHGPDEYQAQQSIRTFFNTSRPERHYVKTALSVLNMGFLRGLSAEYMEATPAINDWLVDLVEGDQVLRNTGVEVLRERAAVGYRATHYAEAAPKRSPYRKMIAGLWRESPVPRLREGERPATMASLLHTDAEGASFAEALIVESGLAPVEWLRRYLDAYLVPLLHSFYAHDLVFMPHGENVILVLRDGVPERVLMKDIAEEIAVMGAEADLPSEVERIRAEVPEDMRLLSLFTDVFDCFLRFLNGILADRGVLAEDDFWRTVAECAADYQASVPHLAERFERYDLFTDRFALSCLNRLQLRDNRQMVDLDDPSGALRLVGTLENPIAAYRPVTVPG